MSIDNNSKEPYKDYFLILNNSLASQEKCENCSNEAIGLFKIVHYRVLNEKECEFNREEELKNLCQNCYLELKSKEQLPSFLEPIYSLALYGNIHECIDELHNSYSSLKLVNSLFHLAQKEGDLKDNDSIDRLYSLNTNRKAELIRDLLRKELLGIDIFSKLIYLENSKEYYFTYRNRMILANDLIVSLLNQLFPKILSEKVTTELFPKLRENTKMIKENEYPLKVNPIQYIKFKNAIFDTVNFDMKEHLDNCYFTYEIPWEIDLDFFEKLRKGLINEDYFQNCLFYQTLRRFYDDENWNKLILVLGSMMLYGKNVRRRFFIIIGEPKTGKSTLKLLIENALKDYAISVSWSEVNPYNRFSFSFLAKGKRIALLSEEPPNEIGNSERYKEILGDSIVSIEEKYKNPIRVETHLRMFAFCNNPPIFEKLDKAIIDRIDVIFTQSPLEFKEIDQDLRYELLKEENIKDFLKFLLFCAYKYYLKGYINENEEEENEKIRELLEKSSDFTIDFVKEVCEEIKDYRELRDDLYNAFIIWRKERGLPLNIGKREFFGKMRMKYQEVKYYGEYYFKGIRIKEEYRAKRQENLI